MSHPNRSERGVASLEYGITIGIVALAAAAMFAQSSAGITGIWKQATAVSAKSPAVAATGPVFNDCMANAHGNSKICSSAAH